MRGLGSIQTRAYNLARTHTCTLARTLTGDKRSRPLLFLFRETYSLLDLVHPGLRLLFSVC